MDYKIVVEGNNLRLKNGFLGLANATLVFCQGGPLLFDATADAGIYRYSAGGVARYFAVSLTDARESDVNNRWAPRERREEIRPASRGAQTLVPLWPQLLALALLLLALEWCVWAGSRSHA